MKSLIRVPPQCLCRALISVLRSCVREKTEDNLQSSVNTAHTPEQAMTKGNNA